MKIVDLALISLGVGVFLIALSFFWPNVISKTVWSEQQAREHAQASAEVHRLSHQHADAADHAEEHEGQHKGRSLEEAKRRYQRSEAMLHQARSYRSGTARILKWMGALCAFLGAAGYLLLAHSAAR